MAAHRARKAEKGHIARYGEGAARSLCISGLGVSAEAHRPA